jgi:hypothetical protein
MFILSLDWFISWAKWNQSTQPHVTSIKSILILLFRLRLILPSGFLFPTFLPKPYIRSSLHSSYIPCQSVPPWLKYMNTSSSWGKEHKLWRSLQCSTTSSFSGQNIPLSTLSSKALSLRSSLNAIDKVLHSCKTIGNIVVLCMLTTLLIFLMI